MLDTIRLIGNIPTTELLGWCMNKLPIASDGHILRVPVSMEAVASDHASMVCMWPDHVFRIAAEGQGYELDELPPNAVRAAMLWQYFGEFENGGHGGYWVNTSGDVDKLRMGAELLGIMRQPAYQVLLEEFGQFIFREQDNLIELYAEDQDAEAPAMFKSFDDRLYDLENAGPGLTRLLRDWLLGQSWVVIDPTSDHLLYSKLRASIPPHPLKEQRKSARLRRAHAENHGSIVAFLIKLRETLLSAKRT